MLQRLDPRTLLALLFLGNIVLYSAGFSGLDMAARVCFMVIPAVVALLAGRWRAVAVYAGVTGLAFAVETLAVRTGGAPALLVAGLAGLVTRVLPAAMYGYAFLAMTRVSELMAALERWRLPQFVVIPCAVVLRFLPTALEENRQVAQAMRARGLTLRSVGVGSWLEYRLVPLMVSTVRSGEELTQAALTRGLGAPGPYHRIARVGPGPFDGAMLGLAVVGTALWVWP